MKKEWLLMSGVAVITLLVALLMIRWLAPQLLGVPADLQMVKVSKKVIPFFENAFRKDDYRSKKMILSDPITRVRARPLYPEIMGWGPNDILGFRNRNVPNIADVVVIGDSLTYGNNVVLKNNWPSRLVHYLSDKQPILYNMSTGGWAAVQYLDMFYKALVFQPRIVVVAFYTGNDSLESFWMAYSQERWTSLRLNPKLNISDGPVVTFPPPESELWKVKFKDGSTTIFSPKHRYASNQEHPAIKTGYDIMREVALRMSTEAARLNVQIVFTIIPTKELVYEERIRLDQIEAPEDYRALVKAEKYNLNLLVSYISKLPNSTYVDLLSPLQRAAFDLPKLYPSSINGHPKAAGYDLIARILASSVNEYLPHKPSGLARIEQSSDKLIYVLVEDEGVWRFKSEAVVEAAGWDLDKVPVITFRDIATLPLLGTIYKADSERFGSTSVER